MMQSLSTYLSRYREEVPLWLANYELGSKVSFSDFMNSRVGYYPGSGYDGNLVSVANRAHCVHCFLYVDYWIRKRELQERLDRGSFRGYHSIGRINYEDYDLFSNGVYPVFTSRMPKYGRETDTFVNKDEQPYCFMEILERNKDKNDSWGAQRIAVTFLFADGVATYYQFFCKDFHKAPWIVLLQDHAFGGNYDLFGKGGILDDVIQRTEIHPPFVICANQTEIWDGYNRVEGVNGTHGGLHHFQRYLYAARDIDYNFLINKQ